MVEGTSTALGDPETWGHVKITKALHGDKYFCN
jgi:hypothetical protein